MTSFPKMLNFYENHSNHIFYGKICDHAGITLITIGLIQIDPDGWWKMRSVKPDGGKCVPSIVLDDEPILLVTQF